MSELKARIAQAAARVQKEKSANATDPKVAERAQHEAERLMDRAERERES